MDEKSNSMLVFIYVLFIPVAEGAIPGVFFWKPRLGLDLSVPTTEYAARVSKPNKQNIEAGLVVLIDGYSAGITVSAMAAGLSSAKTMPFLDPTSSYFYTNTYQWGLRYFSMIPTWMSGQGGNFCDTHKVWRKRFYYMDELVPTWMRKILFYVPDKEWAKEAEEMKRFKKYAEPAFGKHYRYPKKYFDNWRSEMTSETVENVDSSSLSDVQENP